MEDVVEEEKEKDKPEILSESDLGSELDDELFKIEDIGELTLTNFRNSINDCWEQMRKTRVYY